MSPTAAVFLAVDTRHDRNVAIKVLAPHLLEPPQLVTRFRRLRLAAQLRHPNIVTIHDVEQRDAASYIVLEYIDGASLADVLHSYGAARVPLERTLHTKPIGAGG